jgi:hypothetical protein
VNPDDTGVPDISYLKDPRVSWAAKGLYSWRLTQPQGTLAADAYEVSLDREELTRALEELSNLGVLKFDNPLHPLSNGRNANIQA